MSNNKKKRWSFVGFPGLWTCYLGRNRIRQYDDGELFYIPSQVDTDAKQAKEKRYASSSFALSSIRQEIIDIISKEYPESYHVCPVHPQGALVVDIRVIKELLEHTWMQYVNQDVCVLESEPCVMEKERETKTK